MNQRIGTLLATTKGVASATQLIARGVSRRDIERALGQGHLLRIARNALVDGAVWRDAASWERHELRARALAAAMNPTGRGPVVLSHHSALTIHGVGVHGVDDRVHVVKLDGKRGRTSDLVRVHRGVPTPFVTRIGGIRVVSPAAACIQVAARFGAEAGLVSADDALHRSICSVADLKSAQALGVARSSRSPGELVALADARIESAAESRARWAFHLLGFAQPTPQAVITDDLGDFVARVDFLFERVGVIVEVDGMGKYDDRAALRSEKLREDRLRSLGYEVVRLTWADLVDPLVVRRKVLAGVSRAA